MCGITGVRLFRNENAFDKACAILQAQNHRGTASTGMAYFHDGSLTITKDVVSPENFKGKHLKTGNIIIGHNRMPSVGAVNIQNAHPFFACDGSFALLHNGSEHTGILRDLMIKLGHKFEGDTDSEVICHAIEEFAKTMELKDAILKVFEDCRFTTLLILTKEGEIYGIGENAYIIRDENGIYIASEKDSFLALFKGKRKRLYHSDDALFRITKEGKLYFMGEFEKEKTTISEKRFEKVDDESDGGFYLGGRHFFGKKKKEPEMDDEDVEAELDRVEAEHALKKGEYCDCAESEVDFGSGICNKCKKFVEDWRNYEEEEII